MAVEYSQKFQYQPAPKHFPTSRDAILELLLPHATAYTEQRLRGGRGSGKERVLGEPPSKPVKIAAYSSGASGAEGS
jgi:hypothetical protein